MQWSNKQPKRKAGKVELVTNPETDKLPLLSIYWKTSSLISPQNTDQISCPFIYHGNKNICHWEILSKTSWLLSYVLSYFYKTCLLVLWKNRRKVFTVKRMVQAFFQPWEGERKISERNCWAKELCILPYHLALSHLWIGWLLVATPL